MYCRCVSKSVLKLRGFFYFTKIANLNVVVFSALKIYVTPVTIKKKITIRKQLHGYKNKLAMYIQLKKHMTGRKKLIVLFI